MAEGNETPGGEPGSGQPGAGRRTEGDLLAERRARRAADSGEAALIRRAEAAEATVLTLERHVASLQQRLRDAEEDERRLAELLELERASALERETELRRVKQREYAEQQLRVEAEERLGGLDRESGAELERLGLRVSGSERETAAVAERLERLQRQLTDAEQAAATERAAVRRAEQELAARVGELERRAAELARELESERGARRRSEEQLESMRHGHRQLEGVLGDMRGIVQRLLAAFETERAGEGGAPPLQPRREVAPAGEAAPLAGPEPRQVGVPPLVAPEQAEAHGAEMADALAAAVERLRARAQAAPELAPQAAAQPPAPKPHRHSISTIGRVRIWRKQRRKR